MDEDERERILAEARKNLDPRKRQEEQLELARRVMSLGGRDPVAEWKAEGEALDAARAAAKAELLAQKNTALDWSEIDARIDARLAAQRQFFLNVLKESMDAAAVFAEAADRKLSELEAILRKSPDHDRTRVLDLPPLPRRVN
jgi:hypothetical protein